MYLIRLALHTVEIFAYYKKYKKIKKKDTWYLYRIPIVTRL